MYDTIFHHLENANSDDVAMRVCSICGEPICNHLFHGKSICAACIKLIKGLF
ncbi:MAG: hypothetical protein LBS85_02945 [Clostridiales Family XIII bacterium]|nr:hypothetical protein [Clostridiales Family XIII bacterium]